MGLHDVPRRTKIICTIGPASSSKEILEELILAGLDVARLNFSHGTHEEHERVYATIRAAEKAVQKPIAILQDLCGPKIRLGRVDGQVELSAGGEVILSVEEFIGGRDRLPVTYDRLAKDSRVGEQILLVDGRLVLTVLEVKHPEVRCRIDVGGVVSSSKGINLPGTAISVPSLTPKDLLDLELGLRLGVDYVALSFVRTPHDVLLLQQHMQKLGRVVPTIAKIEKPQAVDNLEGIIDVADGIMVARGDLGVELAPEKVPTIQRRAIRLARQNGKLTVVATQMLMSMTEHAHPTHAEVSDVANAVFDGTDAVMLSDETAAGLYPVKAVETMAALARSAEDLPDAFEAPKFADSIKKSHAWVISHAAVVTAADMNADAIVAFTQRGLGPRLVANWRPSCRILACATTDEDVRRMAFYWGVHPIKIAPPTSVESLVAHVENAALERGILPDGSTIVITSKMPFTERQATNMLKLHQIARAR